MFYDDIYIILFPRKPLSCNSSNKYIVLPTLIEKKSEQIKLSLKFIDGVKVIYIV